MLVAAFDIRDLSAFIFQKKTKKKRNIEKEILIVYFGSSDLIQFDTLLGGLNTIPEVLDPQIFEHGWGLVQSFELFFKIAAANLENIGAKGWRAGRRWQEVE